LRRHIFVPQHFWQYVALHFGFGPPGTEISVGQFLWDLLATQVWLAVPPMQLRGKAMAVVGAPGAGKTVTLLRLAYLAARAGRKVCFADCKGTDPTLVPALIAAYRLGNPAARIGCWPEQAMDMWRGTQAQVQSRLLAIEQFTEPFYQRVPPPACAWP
jgi:type II secretory pathway predicted ATPase ExeA